MAIKKTVKIMIIKKKNKQRSNKRKIRKRIEKIIFVHSLFLFYMWNFSMYYLKKKTCTGNDH